MSMRQNVGSTMPFLGLKYRTPIGALSTKVGPMRYGRCIPVNAFTHSGSSCSSAPHLLCDFHDAGEFVLDGTSRKAAAARVTGESALRREAKLLDRHRARSLVDAPLQRIGGLDRSELGRDKAQHYLFALRQEAQRG